MLKKVSATIIEGETQYTIRFGLPPLYKGGKLRGRLRLPLPKNIVTKDCTLFFQRLPSIYARRIRIVNWKDVYVESGLAFHLPKKGIWKVFIEVSPDALDHDW